MASLIHIPSKVQEAYSDIPHFLLEETLHSTPCTHVVDRNYPIIAKGNIIEGIEAKE